jgi:hypothetical protein
MEKIDKHAFIIKLLKSKIIDDKRIGLCLIDKEFIEKYEENTVVNLLIYNMIYDHAYFMQIEKELIEINEKYINKNKI